MEMQWEILRSGPDDAQHTVLLLPGGMCSARSYAEVMAEPALAGVRLVAATMPGQAGAPVPASFEPADLARVTAELAKSERADVILGFSMGAGIAYEMVVGRLFTGPVVLSALSLSTPDEPAFFRGIIRLTYVLGTLPMRLLRTGAGSMAKKAPIPQERRDALTADFARNELGPMRDALRAYRRWLTRGGGRAERLCQAGVPTWVLHAEHGDGALTAHERAVLEECPHVQVETIPGKVFFLPNEVPGRLAELAVEALAAV